MKETACPMRGTRLAFAAILFVSFIARGEPIGNAFTYQGRILDAGIPAQGLYDFRFTLYDSIEAGNPLGASPLFGSAVVSNGVFTVTLDFGPGVFDGNARWLGIAVRTNAAASYTTLTPRTPLTPLPYALHATTVSSLPANSVGSAQIMAGAVQSGDILDGTISLSDLNFLSVDGRYVLKSGDSMSGPLTLPSLVADTEVSTPKVRNPSGILSLQSRSDVEISIDQGGVAFSAFQILNGAGNTLYSLSESGTARLFGNSRIDGTLGVGTTTLDAHAVAQFNLPSSTSIPHIRIKSPLTNAGFGLQFTNPLETWFLGPNIGNWSDQRFVIIPERNDRGLTVAANGNVGINSVSAPSPFATLTVDGSIGFPTVATPALFVYQSGTANAEKPLIMHSPAFPGYGLYYADDGDRFLMKSSAADTTPSLVVDLDSNWVTIANPTPKPGYELSVNGQIVCEEILVQDSSLWPDYVFEESYPLSSLASVEAHIKEHKHLPGIPSAEQISREGIKLGDMQKRLLEKIEELTLHLIAQDKKLAAQNERIQALEAQLRSSHQAR